MKFVVVFLAVLAVGSVSATPLLGLDGVVNNVLGSVNSLVEDLLGKLNGTLGDLSCTLKDLVGTLSEVLNQLVAAISKALEGIVAQLNTITPLCGCGLIGTVTGLVGTLGVDLEGIIGLLENVNLEDIVGQLDALLNNLLCTVQDLIQTVVAAVVELVNKVSKAVNEALCQLQVALRSVLDVIYQALDKIYEQLAENELLGTLNLNGLFEQVQAIVGELLVQVGEIADKAITNVRVLLRTLSKELQKILCNLQDSLNILGLECYQS